MEVGADGVGGIVLVYSPTAPRRNGETAYGWVGLQAPPAAWQDVSSAVSPG